MLVFSDLEDQSGIWEETKDLFASDFLHHNNLTEYNDEIYLDALDDIQEHVWNCGGGRITEYGLPPSRDGEKTSNVIRRERSYNKEKLQQDVTEKVKLLNDIQRHCYDVVMSRTQTGSMFDNNGIFLNASGGTGKSFVLNMLLDSVRSQGKIALAVASSGIAATVLHGGRTAHNMFKIPLMECNEIRSCGIKKNSELAKLLKITSLIVWDEVVMANKNTLTALNITLRDVLENDKFMGGTGESGPVYFLENFGISVKTREELVNKVYDDIENNNLNASYFEKRAIISPTNDDVDSINSMIYEKSEEEVVYNSVDTATENDTDIQTSVFNALTSPSLPLHQLKVKIGSVLMIIRNICPPKLCNGSRIIVTNLKKNVIVGKILGGSYGGEQVLIPKITLEAQDTSVPFKRKQFPVKLSYAMPINKSQGQTFERCGLLLDSVQCFAHGQLHVVCSRVTNWNSLIVYTGWEKQNCRQYACVKSERDYKNCRREGKCKNRGEQQLPEARIGQLADVEAVENGRDVMEMNVGGDTVGKRHSEKGSDFTKLRSEDESPRHQKQQGGWREGRFWQTWQHPMVEESLGYVYNRIFAFLPENLFTPPKCN
ncbi:ATP-dependent DNA helicase Pif1-like [Oratosquilla oratoria]|uniref:ATP-dependent DNA helicase Pif1-like n=1 Tax=Oratosquilla oratoria TaxID=337810 RepID=UPI003F757FA1